MSLNAGHLDQALARRYRGKDYLGKAAATIASILHG
jgi:hypothetical protein